MYSPACNTDLRVRKNDKLVIFNFNCELIYFKAIKIDDISAVKIDALSSKHLIPLWMSCPSK